MSLLSRMKKATVRTVLLGVLGPARLLALEGLLLAVAELEDLPEYAGIIDDHLRRLGKIANDLLAFIAED